MLISAAILTFPLRQPVAIFLLVLAIILLAPLILNRLKIPHIVGMILCGMLVGPHCFNLLSRDASFEIFGEVGILYLMFLAGAEIDIFNLRKNYRAGSVFGLLSFAIPSGIGLLLAHYTLGVNWLTAGLIASMYGSHTLLSYPIVNRFGLTNARPVVIAICGTMIAVFLALVELAGVVSIRVLGRFEWIDVGMICVNAAIYTIVIGKAFPWICRRFFKAFNDQVTQFIFVLAMVFIASLAAQLIGLEAILGAFYAGLILNPFLPSRSGLMNHIRFVGNAIFIPYFLIGVGMLINIHVILRGWGVAWIGINMIATALLTKWIAAWITQKTLGMGATDRRVIFGLSAGKAAATIAAVMVGYRYGLVAEDIMNGAVLMILGCSIVASIATERAAIKLRISLTEEELKQEHGPRRQNARQVVAVANPLTAESLTKLAIMMRHPRNDISMGILYVRNTDDPPSVARGKLALNSATQTAISAAVKSDEIERFDMNTVAGIVNVMRERKASDVILGFHRRSNIVDSFYGSMIEQLLKTTNKTVTMARCFIPVNTVVRIFVVAPMKAQFETGFRMWVERIGNLGTQLACKVVFLVHKETSRYIEAVLHEEGYNISYEISQMESYDDFITMSGEIEEDDLLVMISARRTSVSFTSELENVPGYLSRYFTNHNIVMIYPEQFGSSNEAPEPIDSLVQNVPTAPSPALLSLTRIMEFFQNLHNHNSR